MKNIHQKLQKRSLLLSEDRQKAYRERINNVEQFVPEPSTLNERSF